ncbi:MAG: hypothetical protein PHQ40_11635 [Anaerolineaceae bacterium]|nr:hypothetical protein [Anaerolineaceae bacterium]
MWIEYVRDGLKKGQLVFRRSVIEKLMEEVDHLKTTQGDNAEVATLKHELAVAKKQYRDLNIRLHQVKAVHLDNETDERSLS